LAVEVVEVSSRRTMEVFNNFPGVIYRGFYRAPVFPDLDRSSPYFDQIFTGVEARPFLAVRNGRAVGRIAACLYRARPGGAPGYFGYFESLNDPAAAAALVEAAAGWLAAGSAGGMTGPVELTPHERLGLLVEGFGGYHHPGMPYNPPYYAVLLEQSRLVKEMDLYAYHYHLTAAVPEKLARVAARAGRLRGLSLREINFSDPAGEGEVFSLLHNGSMEDIWGFVPLTPAQASAIWRKLKGFYDPGLILVAEVRGEPAGICLAMLPLTRYPLFSLSGRRHVRLAVLAVLPRYRFKGLEAALIMECGRRARCKGASTIEFSLVAEDNAMMNKIIQGVVGVKKSRIYRIYKSEHPLLIRN